jgi:O-antigen ligase
VVTRVAHLGLPWGLWLRRFAILTGTVMLAAAAGALVARHEGTVPKPLIALVALAGAIVFFSIPPSQLFLGWLFLAPLLQNSSDLSPIGRPLSLGLYLAPALVLGCLTMFEWKSRRDKGFVDVLPAAYVLYVFGSLALTTSLLHTNLFGSIKEVFGTTVTGAVVYYFLVFGPGASIRTQAVVRAVLSASLLQAVLGLVEWRSGFNLWGSSEWHFSAIPRSVSTLDNPAALGVFIGIGIVVALAVLTWDGPAELKRLSRAMLIVGLPGLVVTYTRAPILATTIAAVAVILMSRRSRLLAVGTVASATLALVVAWPTLTASQVYTDRISNRGNVDVRLAVQHYSVRLAKQRPLTGWGYGSFDKVKDLAALRGDLGNKSALVTTSHNTFLTLLVEYGGLGVALLVTPWIVITRRGFIMARRPSPERWLLVSGVASIAIFVLSALANDFRFFSFIELLPWLFLGLIRRSQKVGDDASIS